MRRVVDIVVAIVVAIALFPLFALIASTILITMGRPVLFRQSRPGLYNVPFDVVKFRTMRAPRFEGESDRDRTTRVGAFLRASSVDELPQVWNILRGQMSLIGPRPLPIRPPETYTAAELGRLVVRPGLTGWAQVNGRNSISPTERIELDIWYIYNRSLRLDVKILLLTVGKVLTARGIDGPLEPWDPGSAAPQEDATGIAAISDAVPPPARLRGAER